MLAPGFDLPLLFVQCYLHVLSSLSLCRWQLLTDNEARGTNDTFLILGEKRKKIRCMEKAGLHDPQ